MLEATTMFVLEAVFIYLRTVNISHVANGSLLKSLISGNLLGLLYLITTALGVNAVLNIKDGWPVVVAYFVGGSIGLFLGIRKKF